MAQNEENPINPNFEEINKSLHVSLEFQRGELIQKDDKIIKLEKKLSEIHQEYQEKLAKYDEMYAQVKFTLQRYENILSTERLSYSEQHAKQYFDLMHKDEKITELVETNSEMLNQFNNLNKKLELEVEKSTMTKEAYQGVFQALITNFKKLYRILEINSEPLDSETLELETKIQKIFETFPTLLSMIDLLKKKKERDIQLVNE